MLFLDSAVLDSTEWVCRRFQLLTGKTNVWIAVQLTNLSIVVYFVWAAMYFWNTDVVTRTIVGLFCGGLLYALSQTVLKVPIEAYEKSAYLRAAKGLRNPRRIRDVLMRTSFLTLSIMLVAPVWYAYTQLRVPVVLLTYSLITLTTVLLYVLACDPLPPCAGKVREWLGGLVPSRVVRPTTPRLTERRTLQRAQAERSLLRKRAVLPYPRLRASCTVMLRTESGYRPRSRTSARTR